MILPVIPLTWFFGDAQVTYYFWAMLSSAVLAGSVYLIGRRWYGVCGGLLAAAALLLSNNIVFLNLSSGYPDIMSRALFCVALIFALLARERIVSRGPFPIWFILIVGITLGWAFEARETSLLAWPIVAIILWRRGTVVRTLLWLLLALAMWAAVDIMIGAVATVIPS